MKKNFFITLVMACWALVLQAATIQHLEPAFFADVIKGRTTGTDVITGQTYNISETIDVPARGTMILELK